MDMDGRTEDVTAHRLAALLEDPVFSRLEGDAESFGMCEALLAATLPVIDLAARFSIKAFYLVEERSAEFLPAAVHPTDSLAEAKHIVEELIEHGVFAQAIREKRPIIAYTPDGRMRVVLKVLNGACRTRGMFVGLVSAENPAPTLEDLALLTTTLKEIAHGLESLEHYSILTESACLDRVRRRQAEIHHPG